VIYEGIVVITANGTMGFMIRIHFVRYLVQQNDSEGVSLIAESATISDSANRSCNYSF